MEHVGRGIPGDALPAGGVRPRRFTVNRIADTPRKDVRLRASPDYSSLVASVYRFALGRFSVAGRVAPGNCTPRPSSPGESHPEALTDPCLSLSAHTARAIHGELAPSVTTRRFLPLPVDHVGVTRMTRSLRSVGITPLHSYYGAVRPSLAHWYSGPHGSSACAVSLCCSRTESQFRFWCRLLFRFDALSSDSLSLVFPIST